MFVVRERLYAHPVVCARELRCVCVRACVRACVSAPVWMCDILNGKHGVVTKAS